MRLCMPGPFMHRILPVKPGGATCWRWNGDTKAPTLSPSIVVRNGSEVCHAWVRDGLVQFLPDCTHEFAGRTVDLLEVDGAVGD